MTRNLALVMVTRSHMGWLMDSDGTKIRRDKGNASDLSFHDWNLPMGDRLEDWN